MSATIAPSPWPAPSAAASPGLWRFGRELVLAGGQQLALQWELRRNGSLTPRRLLAVYLALCGLSALFSAAFWWQGAAFVSAFAGAELLAVGAALLLYARHAGDLERLTLAGRTLAVEQRLGTRVEHADFAAEWLSVEPAAGQGSLIELQAHGRTLRVGRFLRPELRAAFAQELRRALRLARIAPYKTDGSETE